MVNFFCTMSTIALNTNCFSEPWLEQFKNKIWHANIGCFTKHKSMLLLGQSCSMIMSMACRIFWTNVQL
ncbi:hypothetical protein BpHYR1_044560 [Brachionus plicatilis]|uniref:Uncharacterized protein n=1 Tax=Brachionus plicatilis TaxID=10195 RepID=A0A3M7R1R0_BRAPC|nr:hypothetical protein BpHYR1_044560 [Brachionus plicatilis]